MNGSKFNWDYSEKSDILNVHTIGKKTAGSAELGDFTIDFDKLGSIVGVEIMNASDFLGKAGITKAQLVDLQNAELSVTQKGGQFLIVWVMLKCANVEHIVPLPTPVVAERSSASVEA